MSFRRFLYLAADDLADRGYSLRRIDMSRFFLARSTEGAQLDSGGGGVGATDPSGVDEVAGGLPEPLLRLGAPPKSKHECGSIDFMPFKIEGNGGENLKIVSMDQKGRALLCDPGVPPFVLPLPRLVTPKFAPFSLNVGGRLYVMESFPEPPNGRTRHSFEVLTFGSRPGDVLDYEHLWYWRSLQPPPYVYEGPRDHSRFIDSYAVVGGSNILVSNKAGRTYRFDTAGRTWSKAGDWPLPFSFLAEYVPEHGLWFGLSPMDDGYRFSAIDLTPASALAAADSPPPPKVHGLWQEYGEPPPEWTPERCFAVHLGSARFCIARFFEIGTIFTDPESHRTYKREEELEAVLTGVEVERGGGGELRVIKHKSERYKLDPAVDYWVL